MPHRLRPQADQAFSRAAGAPLVPGNQVTLLRDARENYPAWLDAIARAEKWIHFELYLIHSDRAGRMFAEALAERARAGVRVRLLTDWLGSIGKTSFSYWRQLRAAGVDARTFNRLSLSSPFSWMSRDHRKVLCVDGRVAFVTGLCVGEQWLGDPEKGIEPWRDTGVSIAGPAVADVEAAFATSGATPAPRSPTTRNRPRADSRRRRHRPAGDRVDAGRRRDVPPRSTRHRARPPHAVGDRRVFRRRQRLRRSLVQRGPRRRGRAAARAWQRQRHRDRSSG